MMCSHFGISVLGFTFYDVVQQFLPGLIHAHVVADINALECAVPLQCAQHAVVTGTTARMVWKTVNQQSMV